MLGRNLSTVDKIEAVDRYTVRISLKTVDPEFLGKILGLYILSKVPADRGVSYDREDVGTGPFRVAEHVPNSKVILERFDNYWQEGKPYPDRVEEYSGFDRSGQIAAFAARQNDYMVISERAQLQTMQAAVPDMGAQ